MQKSIATLGGDQPTPRLGKGRGVNRPGSGNNIVYMASNCKTKAGEEQHRGTYKGKNKARTLAQKLSISLHRDTNRGRVSLFNRLDRGDNDQVLSREEFVGEIDAMMTGKRDRLSKEELGIVFDFFAKTDGDEATMNFTEFERVISDQALSEGNRQLVEKVFKGIDVRGDGFIDLEDVKKRFNAKFHPKYQNGEWTEDDVFLDYLRDLESKGCINKDDRVSRDEFFLYYNRIRATVDSDTYFDCMMRQAYPKLLNC